MGNLARDLILLANLGGSVFIWISMSIHWPSFIMRDPYPCCMFFLETSLR